MASPSPIIPFIKYAIESARNGPTRAYLLSAASGEKAMRDACFELKAKTAEADAATHVYETLRNVNAFYRTRYSLGRLRDTARIAFESVRSQDWWRSDPPSLLQCSDAEVGSVIAFVRQTLKRISSAGLHNPYSLLTKWMHFCFPNSFVIYDWQVALSVQMWSYLTFALGDTHSDQYAAGHIAQPGGIGYDGLVNFYRLCWQSAKSDQQDALQAVAQDLSRAIGAHVSVIDVIDKALWHANGDPRKMGLLTLGSLP